MFLSIGGTRSSVSNTVVYNKSERSIPTLSWSRGTLAVNDGYERAERFHLNACADYVSRSHFPSLPPSLSLSFLHRNLHREYVNERSLPMNLSFLSICFCFLIKWREIGRELETRSKEFRQSSLEFEKFVMKKRRRLVRVKGGDSNIG